MVVLCKNCHSLIFDDEKTCRYCGAKIEAGPEKESGEKPFQPQDNMNATVYGPPKDFDLSNIF